MDLVYHGGVESGALFSLCYKYRYVLWRIWDARPRLLWIGLNPSKADGRRDDNTIKRMTGYARDNGHGGIYVINVHAAIATEPKDMKLMPDAVGPKNDEFLLYFRDLLLGQEPGIKPCLSCDLEGEPFLLSRAVACWGADGDCFGRLDQLLELYKGCLVCLGRTQEGYPRHPLRLAKTVPFERYD